MRQGLRYGAAALMVVAFAGLTVCGAGDDRPKYDIETIMKKAHKKDTGLYPKVIAGKATADEKKELVELYVELAKNKPEKGSQESWKKKTGALVAAAKDVAADKEGSVAGLKKAANCKACHEVHKGD